MRARCPCWAPQPPPQAPISLPTFTSRFSSLVPRGLRISLETVFQQGSVSKRAFRPGWAGLHLSEVSPPESPNSSSHAHGGEQVKWGAGELGKEGRWQPWTLRPGWYLYHWIFFLTIDWWEVHGVAQSQTWLSEHIMPHYRACRILVPQAGVEPLPLPWKFRVLTNGPPWKSSTADLFFLFVVFKSSLLVSISIS